LTHKNTDVFDSVLPRNPQLEIDQILRGTLLTFKALPDLWGGGGGPLSIPQILFTTMEFPFPCQKHPSFCLPKLNQQF